MRPCKRLGATLQLLLCSFTSPQILVPTSPSPSAKWRDSITIPNAVIHRPSRLFCAISLKRQTKEQLYNQPATCQLTFTSMPISQVFMDATPTIHQQVPSREQVTLSHLEDVPFFGSPNSKRKYLWLSTLESEYSALSMSMRTLLPL